MLSRTTEIALFPRIRTIRRVSQEHSRMPVFKSITEFSSKPSLDGTEEIQVPSTHKINLKEAFEQLGNFLNVSVNADSKWSFPELKTDVPLQTWVGALAYACGLRDFNETRQDMFRFLLGANGDASVFGVLFWDAVNAVKVAVLLSNYGLNDDASSTQPIAIYEGGGDSSSIDAAIDDAEFIQEITESGKWTRMFKVNSEGGGSTAEQIVAGSSGSPLDAPSAYVGWNPTSMSVEQALVALAYAAGIRNTDGDVFSAPFRIITQTSMGPGITICSYMPVDDASLKWEFSYEAIRLSYASGNLLTGTPTDEALLDDSSWEVYPIRVDFFEGVGPTDAVMTSAAITVKAGDNINASATTLAVTVGGSPSFNTVNKYLRDAVISVAYNAAVTFSAQNSTVVVRKSADIDTVTASSGKKVYTIHWSPLAVQNGIVSRWEAYVNVAVYV